MIIISDFDGVIVKSIDELAFINYSIFKNNYNINISFSKYKKIFKIYKYLVGPASEYLILNLVIKKYQENQNINFINQFNKLNKGIKVIKKKEYENIFFKERKKIIKKDFKTWISKFKITNFCKFLIKNKKKIIIVSTKDLYSINKIIKFYKIGVINIFSSRDFDKLKTKGKIINKIIKIYKNEKDFIFIDDSDHHLKTVNNKKVNVYFANWGYQKKSNFTNFNIKMIDENL